MYSLNNPYVVAGIVVCVIIAVYWPIHRAQTRSEDNGRSNRRSRRKGWGSPNTWDTLPIDWPPLGIVGVALEGDEILLGDLPIAEANSDEPRPPT
jgi:hypothetical protein